MTRTVQLADETATRRLGAALAEACRPGDVLALQGDLGAGKTTLVQGLAAALGIGGPVPSPTFVLMREYAGRLPLIHVDAYRLSGELEAAGIGLDEWLEGDAVVALEWAEQVTGLLPPTALWLRLETHPTGRRATLSAPDLERWTAALDGWDDD